MSTETTIHVHKRTTDPFARVPKTVLDDETLSWKAKGILAYLIGKPADWKVIINDLVKRSTDRHAAVKTGLKELRKAGYARLECLREKGKVVAWKWHVADEPLFKNVNNLNPTGSPEVDFPLVGNRQVENPQVENPRLLRKIPTETEKEKRTTTTRGGELASPGASPSETEKGAEVFIKRWCECYQKWFGLPYRPSKKDKLSAQEVFSTFKRARLRDLLYIAFQMWDLTREKMDIIPEGKDPLWFNFKAQQSVDFFCRHLEKIIAEQDDNPENVFGKISAKDREELEEIISLGRGN